MPGSKSFQIVAVVQGMAGMVWGLYMGISHDHTMMPAHAHLNLLGWVSLSIMAAYYRGETGRRVAPWLRGLNFWLSATAPPVFAIALALELAGHSAFAPIIGLGGVLAMGGLAAFAVAVIKTPA